MYLYVYFPILDYQSSKNTCFSSDVSAFCSSWCQCVLFVFLWIKTKKFTFADFTLIQLNWLTEHEIPSNKFFEFKSLQHSLCLFVISTDLYCRSNVCVMGLTYFLKWYRMDFDSHKCVSSPFWSCCFTFIVSLKSAYSFCVLFSQM